MQAHTIDEVIAILEGISEESKSKGSPAGYFAALYKKVTSRVKEGILNGEFEDGERMEKLDVLFANRYLEAYAKFSINEDISKSWKVAFDNTNSYWPIVLQHLLWGINAHINLDLAIATAETASGKPINNLRQDFDKINQILSELVGEVQQELSEIWPILKFILTLSGKIDDYMINFSMKKARDGAWKFANELHSAKKTDLSEMIAVRDLKVAKIAAYINPPGIISILVFRLIRLGERGDVTGRIEILK